MSTNSISSDDEAPDEAPKAHQSDLTNITHLQSSLKRAQKEKRTALNKRNTEQQQTKKTKLIIKELSLDTIKAAELEQAEEEKIEQEPIKMYVY